MNRRFILLLIPILFVISFGCKGRESLEKIESPILAEVNGEEITKDEFEGRFKLLLNHYSSSSKGELKKLKDEFLRQLVDRKLMLQEAKRLNIAFKEDELNNRIKRITDDYPTGAFEAMLKEQKIAFGDWKRDIAERLLMEKLLSREVDSKVKVTREEIQRYYESHQGDFTHPEQVRARQILVKNRKEAEEIIGLLKAGEEFASLAQKRSLGPEASLGGDLGYFSQGQMPQEFEEAISTLKVGETSGIVKTPFGYHIFKLEEKRGAGKYPLSEVEKEIKEKLLKEKREREFQHWLKELQGRAVVKINWDYVEK